MENKPQNVFEKLDKQGKQIEDISQKLEGISINDLYALAKRIWEYGDFQTAQKYYNHISLLKPLDWEAPLYASLCNFKGYHDMVFWTRVPEQTEKIIISTIKYINSLELDSDKKESEMSRCLEIIKNDMLKTKDHYFKYKKEYDDTDSDYIYVLEDYFLNVYNEINNMELKAIEDFKIVLAENCLGLIESTKKIASKITKEAFEEMTNISSKNFDIDFDKIVEENKAIAKPKNELSFDEIKEIKLKGKMYFKYNDKVISNRNFKRNLIMGLLLSLISIFGIVISFIGEWYRLFAFAFSLIYGVLLIIKASTEKKIIKCSSLLCYKRVKNRLTSDGNVVKDELFNSMRLITFFALYLVLFVGGFMILVTVASTANNILKILFAIIAILNMTTFMVSLKGINENHSKFNGKYSYYYKGKYYKFD